MARVSMSDIAASKPAATRVVETTAETVGGETSPETRLVTGEDAARVSSGVPRNRAVKPPYLSLGHNIGDLGATFGAGNFVFDKALSLGNEIKVILLAPPRICLVEDVKFGGDAMPDIVYARSIAGPDIADAEEEVLRRGGALRREDSDPDHPHYRLGADVTFLIQAPEGLTEDEAAMFPYTVGDKNYAAAVYFIRKSAYKHAVASGFGRASLFLGNKPYAGIWRMKSKMETWQRNSYPVPVVTFLGKIDGSKDEASAAMLAELEALSEIISPAE